MRVVIEYFISLVIVAIILIFYWYSRNIVCGYYELLWFRLVDYSNFTTKVFLIFPGIVFICLIAYGIILSRRKDL